MWRELELARDTMNRRPLFVVLLCCGVLAAVALGIALVSAAGPEKQLRMNPGHPIEDSLQLGDTSVTVEMDVDPPLEVLPPTGVALGDWMTRGVPVVVVVEVNALTPRLTATHDWVESVVSGPIVEVIRGRDLGFIEGEPASFVVDGGELQINGTAVRAKKSWARPFQVGARCLVFASLGPDKTLSTWEGSILRLTDKGTWERMLVSESPQIAERLQSEDILRDARISAGGQR
jgi:hypothetical protein